MSLENKENKLYITLGIVVLLTLLLSVFTWGYLTTDDPKISQIATQNVVQSANTLGTKEVVVIKELPKLPQSMKDQYKSSPSGTVFNNYDIEINNRYSYSFPKSGNYHKVSYPKNYGDRYYNGYYPTHGFTYTNSFGSKHTYYNW